MGVKEKKSQNGVDSASKLEAIKNLIFGENIEAYESTFEALRDDIDSKKKFLENYIDDIRKELEQHIDTVATDINIRITDLESNLNEKTEALQVNKVDKKELGKLLIKLGEKIEN